MAMEASVSAPIESTMFLNLSVSMEESSLALVISRSFCSPRYLSSAVRAEVNLSSSDSWGMGGGVKGRRGMGVWREDVEREVRLECGGGK